MGKPYVETKKYIKKSDENKTEEAKVLDRTPVANYLDKPDEYRGRNQRLKQKAQSLFASAKNAREKYDWEWLTRDLYRRGYMFSSYQPAHKTVVLSGGSKAKIPINLTWMQMRVIKNQVTSFRPKWETMPRATTEDAVTNARYSGKLLDYYFDRLRLRKKIKETVIQGLMFSVGGPWQIGHDSDADRGEGEVCVWTLDPYDFYIDPRATEIEDAEYCVKAVRKPINEIKTNNEYNFYEPDIYGNDRVAESEYKQFLLQALKNISEVGEEEEETEILKELWLKTRVTKENGKELSKELKKNEEDNKDLQEGEVLMRVITYIDSLEDPLKVQLLRRNDFPFVSYQADINPNEFYGESWIKHIIPANRVLNALETSTFIYNYKFAKGRLVIDKNSGVNMISNEHGSIIEKNPGTEVSSLALDSLKNSYQIQIENMRRYIEDIGGAHDISLGRIPSGVKSGIGIAELKSADASNQQDLVDNLEDFMEQVGKKILKEISKNYDTPKVIKVLGRRGDPQHFAIVGSKGKRSNDKQVNIGGDKLDLAVIGDDNEVRVTIGSWLAYTKQAQQDKLKELFEAGIISQAKYLEHAEFSDIDDIIKETRQEKLLEQYRGQMAQGTQVSDEEIAEQETNMMVVEGLPANPQGVWPKPEDRHQIHIIIHQEQADHPEVAKHMAEHERLIALGNVAPQVGSVASPQGMLPQGQAPQGMPTPGSFGQSQPAQQGLVPQASPQPNPEEQALLQSMASMGIQQ